PRRRSGVGPLAKSLVVRDGFAPGAARLRAPGEEKPVGRREEARTRLRDFGEQVTALLLVARRASEIRGAQRELGQGRQDPGAAIETARAVDGSAVHRRRDER